MEHKLCYSLQYHIRRNLWINTQYFCLNISHYDSINTESSFSIIMRRYFSVFMCFLFFPWSLWLLYHTFFYTSSLFFSQQTVFNMLVIFCHLLKDKCQLFSYILPLLERLIRTEELVRRWREIVSFLFINTYIHIWKIDISNYFTVLLNLLFFYFGFDPLC